MSIAAGLEQSRRYAARRRRAGANWNRLCVLFGLMLMDAVSFAMADVALHFLDSPPALALFRGRAVDAPNTVIDLVGILVLVFVIVRYLAGDYTRRQLFWDDARATTTALLVCGLVYLVTVAILEPQGLGVSVLVWFAMFFVVPCLRQAMRILLAKAGVWQQPTAILGTSEIAQDVFPALSRELSLGMDFRWVVPESPGNLIPRPLDGLLPIHAAPQDLVDALVAVGCRQVILAADTPLADQTHIIDQMIGEHIQVSIVPSLRRLPLFGMSTSYLFGKDILLLRVRNNLARLPQRILKRTIDIIGGVMALILLSPLFGLIAFLIKREDGGPVFFLQNRVGRNGEDFRCWKFRTMTVDAEAQMARWHWENPALLASYREFNFKLREDPRVTRIGTWLRCKSLDEFPQLINIMLGDMSLVGPRPLLRRELPDYGAVIRLYERVRPGITGLWQISGRSHTTFAQRVSYDEWYIKNWTVWYDVVIMLQTVWVLLRGEGDAY